MLEKCVVAAHLDCAAPYPDTCPFSPPADYPERPAGLLDPQNRVYPAVRELLHRLGLDAAAFGSASWNPLGELVKPGMTVLVKPNTVMHVHGKGGDILSVVVHASVLRPVIDYILIALKGQGRVIIGDSQLIFSDFDKAMRASGITGLLDWYRTSTNVPIELIDFREERGARSWLFGKWRRIPVRGDPRGYKRVDLGERSLFRGIDPASLRIAVASHTVMKKYHGTGEHAYLMPGSVLAAEAVINVAKLKTHRRTGVTLSIKNFMGLPAAKGALPHFRLGSPEEGGDQYIHPSPRKRFGTRLHDLIQTTRWTPVKFMVAVVKRILWETHLVVPFRDDVFEAMWPGNDTVWRTLLDVHRIMRYADKEGVVQSTPQRTFLHIIDGVIAGEGDGPLSPNPVPAGCILAGTDPVAVDVVAAGLMGFDHRKIRLLTEGLHEVDRELPVSTIREDDLSVALCETVLRLPEFLARYNLHLEPHPGWKGNIERE